MLTGRCLCGGVRYEIDGEIGSVVCCHCSQCRRASGAAFATNASVRAEHFRLIAGRDLLTEYESSPGKFRAFCARCGSPILSRWTAHPDFVRIRLGTLGAEGDLAVDHPEALVVVVRVRRVVGVGRIDPEERLEAVGRETRGERALRGLVGALPGNLFETHGVDSPCCTPTPARSRRSPHGSCRRSAGRRSPAPTPRRSPRRISADDTLRTMWARSVKRPGWPVLPAALPPRPPPR